MKALFCFLILIGLASAQTKSNETIVEVFELDDRNTIGEGIEILRAAALKDDKFFTLNVQLPEAKLQARFPGIVIARKVPVSLALFYLCDSADLSLTYENNLWRIQPRSGEEGADLVQIMIENVTKEELSALGIQSNFTTKNGKKWPSGKLERATMFESGLLVRATHSTHENLRTLLKLHRAGYKIPTIDSNEKPDEE